MQRNPIWTAKKPPRKNSRRVPPALSIAEVEAIRAAMKQPDATLISLLAYAGLRPGEALALKWVISGRTSSASRAPSASAKRKARRPADREWCRCFQP
jgi:integrase